MFQWKEIFFQEGKLLKQFLSGPIRKKLIFKSCLISFKLLKKFSSSPFGVHSFYPLNLIWTIVTLHFLDPPASNTKELKKVLIFHFSNTFRYNKFMFRRIWDDGSY